MKQCMLYIDICPTFKSITTLKKGWNMFELYGHNHTEGVSMKA